MEATWRLWERVAVAAAVGAWGVLVARPIGVAAAAAVGVYLLARYALAVRWFVAAERTLSVEYAAARTRASVDDTVEFSLGVTAREGVDGETTLSALLPPAAAGEADSDERSVTLTPGERSASTAFALRFPVAGEVTVPDPTVALTDAAGLFRTTTTVAPGEGVPTVRIDPPAPRAIHVGQAGEEFAAAYGEHATSRGGSGLTPAELRQYVPTDSADQIDWKATARLNDPHVREYEAQTDRRTVLLFDARPGMAIGPTGETMLDYAREVALGYARGAESLGDPAGLYVVDDGGTTVAAPPRSSPSAYRRIRNHLHDATGGPPDRSGGPGDARIPGRAGGAAPAASDAERIGATLGAEESAFARTLAPYFTDRTAYVERFEDRPLFGAVRQIRAAVGSDRWTVVFTSDANPEETREAIRLATAGGAHALVFLTPTALFAADGLVDAEVAYERYVGAEQLRRELDRLPRTTAFELAPGDRLEAVLAARR